MKLSLILRCVGGVLTGALLGGGVLAVAEPPDAAPRLELQSLVREALENNPDIRAAWQHREAAKAVIPQVKTLPDPLISLGYVRPAYTDNDLMPLGLAGAQEQLKAEFDAHYEESALHPMKFRYAMHNFTGGRSGMAKVFEKFLAYAKSHQSVWFCRCIDLARFWSERGG